MKLHHSLACACVLLVAFALGCSGHRDASRQSALAHGSGGHAADAFGNGSVVDASANSIPNAVMHPYTPSVETDGGDECGRQDFDVARKPADILLVLDRSASMQDDVNGDSKPPSKWDLVVPSLQQVITATNAGVNWGLKLFPEGDRTGECTDASFPKTIAVDIAPDHADAVNAAISATGPDGDGTPTGDAIDNAVDYLKSQSDGNPKYILLATDGEPSCAGAEKGASKARPAAIDAVTHAADAGFHTFVVGIATTKSSAQKTLTDLAATGLEAPASTGYYLATTQADLVSALSAITGSVVSCEFPLTGKPPNPDHVGVFIGSDRIARDETASDGWNYKDADQTGIELYGAACDAVTTSAATSVRVVFGCRSDPVF